VVVGLLVSALGSALFWPAASLTSYPLFLLGLGVVGIGFALLQIAANPYVTILGHPTGRLLLSRPGYRVDMTELIKTAAEHGKLIEINGSRYRLDLDWRWHQAALEFGCMLSINPDAHSIPELDHTRYTCARSPENKFRRAYACAQSAQICSPAGDKFPSVCEAHQQGRRQRLRSHKPRLRR